MDVVTVESNSKTEVLSKRNRTKAQTRSGLFWQPSQMWKKKREEKARTEQPCRSQKGPRVPDKKLEGSKEGAPLSW